MKLVTLQTDINMLKFLTSVYGTGSTDESVSIVGLWPPPVGVNRHCVKRFSTQSFLQNADKD